MSDLGDERFVSLTRPCNRTGRVAPGARPVEGVATLGEPDRPAVFRVEYGLGYRVFLLVERLFAQGNRDRVLVRIRPAAVRAQG